MEQAKGQVLLARKFSVYFRFGSGDVESCFGCIEDVKI